jgi:hypothetical protein
VIEKVGSPEAKEQAQKVAQSFFQTTFVYLETLCYSFSWYLFYGWFKRIIKRPGALVPPKLKEDASQVLDKTGET